MGSRRRGGRLACGKAEKRKADFIWNGWSFEQAGLEGGVRAHGRGFGTR